MRSPPPPSLPSDYKKNGNQWQPKVLDPAKTTRMHHTISSPKSFALEHAWVTTSLASSSSTAYKASVWRKLPIIVIFYFVLLVTETIYDFKHRNYSLFYSFHTESLQSIHGIFQVFQRDFL